MRHGPSNQHLRQLLVLSLMIQAVPRSLSLLPQDTSDVCGAAPTPVQIEYRLSMLCEPSGFINEAIDFLWGLDAVDFCPMGIRPDFHLTGLYGDCHALASSMPEEKANLINRLRAFDTSGDWSNAPETAKSEFDSCMLSYDDDAGSYSFVCDQHQWEEEEGVSMHSVQLQHQRIAIEHGLPCTLRKRSFFNVTEYEALYGARPDVFVARCMTETQLLSDKETGCLQRADPDELWVPTEWHKSVIVEAGAIAPEKVFVVPEIVDSTFFHPPAPLAQSHDALQFPPAPFVFISVFKWEWRKGWDVLLLGYWKAFLDHPRKSQVVLRIKTFRPPVGLLKGVFMESGPEDIMQEISAFARMMLGRDLSDLPKIELETDFFSRDQLREFYRSGHVFVLPTRGEGWGLPIVEAMASGLPTIVTNFSGPSAYLTHENSYPLGTDGVDDAGFALPSVKHLKELLTTSLSNFAEAKRKGQVAAEDMRVDYNHKTIGVLIAERLAVLSNELLSAD